MIRGRQNFNYESFVSDELSETITSTIGVEFKYEQLKLMEKEIKLQILDTAIQKRNGSDCGTITSSLYKRVLGIIAVYDVTNRNSFINIKHWLLEIDKCAREGVIRLIVGNKIDLIVNRVVIECKSNFCK